MSYCCEDHKEYLIDLPSFLRLDGIGGIRQSFDVLAIPLRGYCNIDQRNDTHESEYPDPAAREDVY